MMFGLGQVPPSVADVTMSPSTSPCDPNMESQGYLCNVDYSGNVTYQSPPVTQVTTQTAANAAGVTVQQPGILGSLGSGAFLLISLVAVWFFAEEEKSARPAAKPPMKPPARRPAEVPA